MRIAITLASALCFSFFAACGEDSNAGKAGDDHTKSHEYEPMHGGEVVHLGPHKHMVELRHDEPKGEIHLWAFDAHHEVYELPSAPTLKFDEQSLTATGSGNHWTFASDALKEHIHGMMFGIEVWERGEKKTYSQGWHPAH